MDLNQHIVNTDGRDHFHSHGFAKVQNGGRVGSAGKMTFGQRQEIDKNRRLIYSYQRSAVAKSYSDFRKRSIESGNEIIEAQQLNHKHVNQKQPIVSSKKYNPYS